MDEVKDDRRGWHVGRDIPVALLLTMLSLFAAGVTGYTNVQNSIERLAEVSARTGERIDRLDRTVQDSTVPSALNAARISVLEANVVEIKARVTALEIRRK